MKSYVKRFTSLLLITCVALTMTLCISITQGSAASSSKCVKLTIYASGDAGSSASSGNTGHAWITIKNISNKKLQFLSYTIKPGLTISVSKWSEGDIGEGGVYINREQIVCGGSQATSYSIKITEKQLKKIAKATPAESTYDALWYNCTTYSTNMWNLVADRSHQISDGMFSIDIPGTVAKKIAAWKGAKTASYKNDPAKHWADVYYVTKAGKLKCVDSIIIDPISIELDVNSSERIEASFIYSEELNNKITWSSSNEKVATVKDGVVTGKNGGTATITAKYKKMTAKSSVTVRPTDTNMFCVKYLPQKLKVKDWDDKYNVSIHYNDHGLIDKYKSKYRTILATYTYYGNGNVKTALFKEKAGKEVVRVENYTLNEFGVVTSMAGVDNGWKVSLETIPEYYDGTNSLESTYVHKTFADEVGSEEEYVYEYDSDGNYIFAEDITEDAYWEFWVEREYDSKGKLKKMAEVAEKNPSKFKYKYKKGKVIERKAYRNSKKIETVKYQKLKKVKIDNNVLISIRYLMPFLNYWDSPAFFPWFVYE